MRPSRSQQPLVEHKANKVISFFGEDPFYENRKSISLFRSNPPAQLRRGSAPSSPYSPPSSVPTSRRPSAPEPTPSTPPSRANSILSHFSHHQREPSTPPTSRANSIRSRLSPRGSNSFDQSRTARYYEERDSLERTSSIQSIAVLTTGIDSSGRSVIPFPMRKDQLTHIRVLETIANKCSMDRGRLLGSALTYRRARSWKCRDIIVTTTARTAASASLDAASLTPDLHYIHVFKPKCLDELERLTIVPHSFVAVAEGSARNTKERWVIRVGGVSSTTTRESRADLDEWLLQLESLEQMTMWHTTIQTLIEYSNEYFRTGAITSFDEQHQHRSSSDSTRPLDPRLRSLPPPLRPLRPIPAPLRTQDLRLPTISSVPYLPQLPDLSDILPNGGDTVEVLRASTYLDLSLTPSSPTSQSPRLKRSGSFASQSSSSFGAFSFALGGGDGGDADAESVVSASDEESTAWGSELRSSLEASAGRSRSGSTASTTLVFPHPGAIPPRVNGTSSRASSVRSGTGGGVPDREREIHGPPRLPPPSLALPARPPSAGNAVTSVPTSFGLGGVMSEEMAGRRKGAERALEASACAETAFMRPATKGLRAQEVADERNRTFGRGGEAKRTHEPQDGVGGMAAQTLAQNSELSAYSHRNTWYRAIWNEHAPALAPSLAPEPWNYVEHESSNRAKGVPGEGVKDDDAVGGECGTYATEERASSDGPVHSSPIKWNTASPFTGNAAVSTRLSIVPSPYAPSLFDPERPDSPLEPKSPLDIGTIIQRVTHLMHSESLSTSSTPTTSSASGSGPAPLSSSPRQPTHSASPSRQFGSDSPTTSTTTNTTVSTPRSARTLPTLLQSDDVFLPTRLPPAPRCGTQRRVSRSCSLDMTNGCAEVRSERGSGAEQQSSSPQPPLARVQHAHVRAASMLPYVPPCILEAAPSGPRWRARSPNGTCTNGDCASKVTERTPSRNEEEERGVGSPSSSIPSRPLSLSMRDPATTSLTTTTRPERQQGSLDQLHWRTSLASVLTDDLSSAEFPDPPSRLPYLSPPPQLQLLLPLMQAQTHQQQSQVQSQHQLQRSLAAQALQQPQYLRVLPSLDSLSITSSASMLSSSGNSIPRSTAGSTSSESTEPATPLDQDEDEENTVGKVVRSEVKHQHRQARGLSQHYRDRDDSSGFGLAL